MRKRIAQIVLPAAVVSFVFFGLFARSLYAEENPISGRVDLDIRSSGGEWTLDDDPSAEDGKDGSATPTHIHPTWSNNVTNGEFVND